MRARYRVGGRQRAATTISRQLARTFGFFVALLLLVGVAGVGSLAVIERSQAQQQRLESLNEHNTAMLLAMTNAETGVRGYRLSQDRDFLAPYSMGRRDFRGHVDLARASATGSGERDLLQRQDDIARTWFTGYADRVAVMEPGVVRVAMDDALSHKRLLDSFRVVNTELADQLQADKAAAAAKDARVRTAAVAITTAALLGALAVVLAMHRRIRSVVERPLSEVVTVLEDLTAGVASSRADPRAGPEEVRVLARTLNDLADESDRLRAEQATASRYADLAEDVGRGIRDHLVAGAPVIEEVSRVADALGVDRVHIRMIERDSLGQVEQEWHRARLEPLSPEAAAALPGREIADWVRSAYAAGEHFAVDDVTAASAEGVRAFAARSDASAILLVPIGAGGRPLGLLCFMATDGAHHWTPHQVALGFSVATDLGRALVLTGLFTQQQELVDQLRALDGAKTEFLSTVSHELRTPLTSISGYVELLRDGDAGELPPAACAMLDVVDRNTVRLRSLIEDLLTLSRIESGTFRVSQDDVVLADVVRTVAEVLKPAASSSGVELELEPGPGGVVVSADAGQLERALMNLLSNAVKFTPRDGRVTVRVIVDGEWALLEVEDTGIGIPEAEQEALFSRFFRASNATDLAIPGTGLGLLIVRSIIEQHGGEMTVRSLQDVGTTVAVRLPLAATRSASAASSPVPPSGERQPAWSA